MILVFFVYGKIKKLCLFVFTNKQSKTIIKPCQRDVPTQRNWGYEDSDAMKAKTPIIYVTTAAKVFNLSGEGKPYPATSKAVEAIKNEGDDRQTLIVLKDGLETIVHVDEAREQLLYEPSVNFWKEKLKIKASEVILPNADLEGVFQSFVRLNKKGLEFLSPSDKKSLKPYFMSLIKEL